MKRENRIWLSLGIVFVIAAALVLLFPKSPDYPFSTYSAKPDGTKAAYMLLEELGFNVGRKTEEEWDGEGVLIALGPSYLEDSENALVLDRDWRYTNDNIRHRADEFVETMWEYKDSAIVFEEYGRAMVSSDNIYGYSGSLTLYDITPLWLKLFLLSLTVAAVFLMFFYGQRIGAPKRVKEFGLRSPLEGVFATAAALESAKAYSECTEHYYSHWEKSSSVWDKNGEIKQALQHIEKEREALKLIRRIDIGRNNIKRNEPYHESK